MASAALPFPPEESIGGDRLERACEAAAAAAMSSSGARAAIDDAVGVLHDELDGAGVCAFVLEHDRLWSVAVRGYAMIPDGLPLDEGVIGRSVSTGTAQLALDAATDPDFVEVWAGAASELAIPLVTPTGVVGVINIETGTPLAVGAESRVAALGRSLAPRMEELRSASGVDLSSLARLFVYMGSLREAHAIAEVAVGSLGRVLPIESSQLLLGDDSGNLVEVAQWRASAGGPDPMTSEELVSMRGSISEFAMFELVDTSRASVPEAVRARARSVVLIPLRANGEEIGLLAGASRFASAFDRSRGELAGLLSAHAAASIDASLALGRERRSAHTDSLTGLLNRRGLEQVLERSLESGRDELRPVSVIVLDCDDFKEVNDRAGHETGDTVLREIGSALLRGSPEGAAAARLGGDEFVVVLPDTDGKAGFSVAERLRSELEQSLGDSGFPLRLSAGLATYPYDGAGVAELLRNADQALYQAKAAGKNRVLSFGDIASSIRGVAAASAGSGRDRGQGGDSSVVTVAMDASEAIWAEETVDAVLDRLCKTVTFVVGATGVVVSKVDGSRLVDAFTHSMRDIDLGGDTEYLISDFPLTMEALDTMSPRAVSFLDESPDPAEGFLLRELQMNCALLVPVVVGGRSFGLVEAYDQRLRRFSTEDKAVALFLAGQAGRRIESLGGKVPRARRRPLRRVTAA